jgi:triosephosphate isomerase (TIM)
MAGKPRGVLIAGNWKMNHGPAEAEAFLRAFLEKARSALPPSAEPHLASGSLQACVIPPAISLERARKAAADAPFPVHIAAQNAHWERKGAFTGELSGPMLQEIGVTWALVGHSERRQHFGETDESARRRTEGLLAQGFRVILCIGETRAERESGRTEEVLARQLDGALPERGAGAAAYLDGRLVIAYEPVWAIGTGLTATPQQAEEAHQAIRKRLWDRFGVSAAGQTPILYGGSVTPENADSLIACPNVDGALVGGASLKPESLLALLAAGARALQ